MTTLLRSVVPGTEAVEIRFEGFAQTIPVQPQSDLFRNRRVMFTMNKDNELEWINAWANWHCRMHGVDAIVIFDNGSTRYRLEDIAAALAGIEGLEAVGLISWPFRYGPVDPAVLSRPYWPNFLQVASFTVMLRRFAAGSAGILNCDIDELVGRAGDEDVFSLLADSRDGYVRLKGTWIEAVESGELAAATPSPAHFRFEHRVKNPLLARCADKWALDPQQAWLQDLGIFPMMHRIYGMPRAQALLAPTSPFWHFRGINTNWKEERVKRELPPADPRRHTRDSGWLEARRLFSKGGTPTSVGGETL
ncbi:hypothetical protein [Pelagibacterium limicola]|uniref:hypothetical protein n=1 Tax=Pelagibacterium limicola TaxID=2791022 RepID=UPI0018AF8EEB|nr:hypothetical protein [Pelagibacterium limicola]